MSFIHSILNITVKSKLLILYEWASTQLCKMNKRRTLTKSMTTEIIKLHIITQLFYLINSLMTHDMKMCKNQETVRIAQVM